MLIRWTTRRGIFFFLLTNVAILIGGYTLFFTSEPYQFAKNFVASDPRVLQITGIQKSSRVNLFNARATLGERTGDAQFTFNVKAERGDFEVLIEMEKSASLWSATKVYVISTDGKKTNITAVPRESPSRNSLNKLTQSVGQAAC